MTTVLVTGANRGIGLELWNASGVFSVKKLDTATKLLIDKAIIKEGWLIHDLGCGNGVVGVIVKKSVPSCHVICSDVNERAVQLAKMNSKMHDCRMDVLISDGYAKITQI